MQAICKFKCFFRGRSTLPGEVFDITTDEAKTDLVKASFTVEPEKVSQAPKPQAGLPKDELTADEYRRRLDEAGIPYKARDDKPTLKGLWDDFQAKQLPPGV